MKVNLRDGRELSYYEYGPKDGTPVVFSHGFGDSGVIRFPDDTLLEAWNIRIIAPNQPGVGASTPMRGRTLLDWAEDVQELIDALGIDRLVSAGHSAGTAHALAVAYCLKNRVSKIVLAAALETIDGTNNGVYLISGYFKLFLFFHNRRLDGVNRLLIRALAGIGNWNIQKYIALMAREAKADAEVFLQIPETKAMFEESFWVGIQQGGEGMIETLEAVWDWDFDPAEIHIPAVVFYGDKDDMIDNQMTIGLARQLPDSRVKAWKNVGHYGFVKRECWVDFIAACSEKLS